MTEHVQLPGRRLGLRPSDPARPALRLSQVLTGVVPAHPLAVDHLADVTEWGMYQNDRYGVCGPTSVANSRRLTTQYLGGRMVAPTTAEVFDLYRRSGNPAFDPATGADDNGVVMADMLSAVHKGGIAGTRAVAYAKVDTENLDEVRAALAIFGFLLLGCDLKIAQQHQTRLWDYQRSSDWGGHAVLAGAYTSRPQGADVSVITWADRVGLTDTFWDHQVAEAWVCIWPEHLGTVQFEQGIDTDALNVAYLSLTGQPGPFQHAEPAPEPTPPAPTTVDQADRVVAQAMRGWLTDKGL